MAFESNVVQNAVGSDTTIQLRWRDTQGGQIPTYAARDFGIENATLVEFTSDWQVNNVANRARAEWGVFRSQGGNGIVVAVDRNGSDWRISIGTCITWANYGSMVETSAALPGMSSGTFFRMYIRAEAKSDGTTTVTATVRDTSDVDIGSVVATVSVARGNFCGFHSTFDQLGATSTADFKDIRVQAGGSLNFTPVNIATSYVYTFVNDLGEESAPSLASATVQRPDGVSVTVTTPTSAPSGISSTYGVTTKRIYRATTGNTGTAFRFVAEIPLATADYEDVLTDADLGEVLESEEFDLPPDDLRGLIALPNGVLAGFSKNQLCLSAQNRPHAWPVGNRLTVDTDIVGIANIDTTIIVGTESYVYTASGNDPAAYSMSAPGSAQACVAKRSMRYVNEQVGVAYASPDGLMASLGPTSVRNITEGVFTRRQWQDLRPETIRAVVYDDIYVFAFGDMNSGSGGTYMLDLKQTGFGLVRIDFLPTAMFTDPLTDKLYMVEAGPVVDNWLGYGSDEFGPMMVNGFSEYQALGSPVAFSDGTSYSNSVFSGGGSQVHVPLAGGDVSAPTLVEGVTWFPDVASDPAPTFSTADPSSGTWVGFSWVLTATASGYAVLSGPTGTTTITFTVGGAPLYYNGASLEYTAA